MIALYRDTLKGGVNPELFARLNQAAQVVADELGQYFVDHRSPVLRFHAVAALPGNLVGSHLVRAIRPAFNDAHKWLPRASDRAELRRNALKLRFWPDKSPTDEQGNLLDLDWSWIKALRSRNIGELRINDVIGNHDNLRIIFFDPRVREPLSVLWVIAVLQKKRTDFSKAQIDIFEQRRLIVMQRFYEL